MRWATSYRQTKYQEYIDEIHFSRISQIMQYKEEHPNSDKRLCLEILKIGSINFNGEPTTLDLYVELIKKYPDIHLEFYDLANLREFVDLQLNHIYYRYHYPAETYNLLKTLLLLNVSDVYLDEPLTFDLEKVKAYIRNYSETCLIHIRPYIGKPGWMLENESIIHHFWVLPQHLILYESYVDFVDLFAEAETREKALVEAYCVRQEYDNILGALVLNSSIADMRMPSSLITNDLAKDRVNCHQVCMTTYPQRCHKCDLQYIAFAQLQRGRNPHKTESQS